ncbi:hypothetical protein GMW71_17965 [Pectobacterium brasiliense]|nr:hypothetical protein GMW71_17965 [Pectobacterium brasiliense]
MANYVSGNIISQSYVHVEPKWLSNTCDADKNKKIDKIKKDITDFANSRIPFFIGNKIKIEVEFTDGSIKAKITSYGKIVSFLGAFTFGYPEFSESVRAMVKDVHSVGNYINAELLFQTESKSKSERMSVESRLGVFGSLDRVNGKINELTRLSSIKNKDPSTIYNGFLNLHDDILSSLDKISRDAIDDTDVKTAAKMWIDGVSRIPTNKLNFKINNKTDLIMHDKLVNEKKSIIINLNKKI